jgi:PPOX class probable F420-dependent enzyme
MPATVDGRARELIEGKNFANVSTLSKDGSIHSVPVWIDVKDGTIAVNTAKGRGWERNLERDPRITVTVFNQENPYEYVTIRGRASEITEEGADDYIDALAKKYMDLDAYPYRQPGEQRVTVAIEPEKVNFRGA